jgi:hypothetical protein
MTYFNYRAPWTPADEQKLADALASGTPLTSIAKACGRTPQAIHNKARSLGLAIGPLPSTIRGTQRKYSRRRKLNLS